LRDSAGLAPASPLSLPIRGKRHLDQVFDCDLILFQPPKNVNEFERGDYILHMDASEILPGAAECLRSLHARGVRTALGSASKNSPLILDRLGISSLFDVIVDGNKVIQAKPNSEVFLRAARELDIPSASCIVFEDAEVGIEAARRAGMGPWASGNLPCLRMRTWLLQGYFNWWC
jgi:beta-phosphoglucomutase